MQQNDTISEIMKCQIKCSMQFTDLYQTALTIIYCLRAISYLQVHVLLHSSVTLKVDHGTCI